MPDISELSLDSKMMALFIGKPGAGKTLAGASFAEDGRMEFIDFDGRMKPIKLYMPKANIHFTPYSVKNLEHFAYTYLPDLVKSCPYKTVQLAGITSLSTVAVSYQMMMRRGGNDPLKLTKGGLMVPSWDEFNGEAMIIGQVLDALRALHCNVIVEAHPVNRIDINKAEKYTSIVAFGPKVESLIPGYFDEIYYFTTEVGIQGERKYVVHTKPSNDYPMAKTSLPIPDKFEISDELGRPKSLFSLIKAELDKHHIRLGEEENAITNQTETATQTL